MKRCLIRLTNGFGAFGVLVWLFWATAVWAAQGPVPELTGSVTDVAGVLSVPQRQTLEERLAQLSASGPGRDVRVVVVAGIQPESIEAYTQRLVQQAHAGDAVLIVVAVEDRKMRIEVPRALSSVISDAAAQNVIDQQLKPAFRDNRFADGLLAGVGRIEEMLRTGAVSKWSVDQMDPRVLFWGVLGIGSLVLIGVMAMGMGRLKTVLLLASYGGGCGLLLAGPPLAVLLALVAGGTAFAAGAAIDTNHASSASSLSTSNSFSSSGYSSSDSSSSSSSDSGGGGASGDW